MSQRLPEFIEPDRMAETGRFLAGTIAVKKMKRLSPLLVQRANNKTGDVIIDLKFGVDESGQANITGRFEVDVTLQCQRCMQDLDLHIADNISLAIVHSSQQVDNLPSHYEPLLVENDMVSLPELVEDEVLLALPSVPLHEPEDCSVTVDASNTSNQGGMRDNNGAKSQKDSERKSPFDVLKQLRTKE